MNNDLNIQKIRESGIFNNLDLIFAGYVSSRLITLSISHYLRNTVFVFLVSLNIFKVNSRRRYVL